ARDHVVVDVRMALAHGVSAPSSDGLQVTFPEIEIETLVRLGGVAPQIPRLEAHAVDVLRLLAEAVRGSIGAGVAAPGRGDPAPLAARVPGQSRVAGRMEGACRHDGAHGELWQADRWTERSLGFGAVASRRPGLGRRRRDGRVGALAEQPGAHFELGATDHA